MSQSNPLSSVEMRNEPVFSRDEAYEFLLRHNTLMHQEATTVGSKVMKSWLAGYSSAKPIKVLDLACGSKPITIAAIMKQFISQTFHYLGIDINAGLIAQASHYFSFSSNVTKYDFREGDAWNVSKSAFGETFDVIFTGLHLHHGTPEELAYTGQKLRSILSSGGLLLIHDVYCPVGASYAARPKDHPPLVPIQILQSENIRLSLIINHQVANSADWRADLVDAVRNQLLLNHVPLVATALIGQHILERDFSLSLRNQAKLFEALGYFVQPFDFLSTSHPCKRFFSMMAAFNRS